MPIPERWCRCGNRITVGGTDVCDDCRVGAVPACGSCAFWARGYNGTEGIGGHHTDGSVSECRAKAPAPPQPQDHDRALSGDRKFPTTRFDDFCGEWQRGAVSSRLTR